MAVCRVFIAILFLATGTAGQRVREPIPLQDNEPLGARSTCRYEFVVPDASGTCGGSASAGLAEQIYRVQMGIEKDRMQYMSQNLILRDEVVNAEKRSQGYENRMGDIGHALKQLRGSLGNVRSPDGDKRRNVDRLVQQVKGRFTKVLHDMENNLAALFKTIQKDAIEQSSVNAAMELQIHIEGARDARAAAQVKNIAKAIQNLKSRQTSRTGNGGVSVLREVLDKVDQIQNVVNNYDQKHRKAYFELQEKDNNMFIQLSNHSHEIRKVDNEYGDVLAQMLSAEQHTAKNSGNLNTLRAENENKINVLGKMLSRTINESRTLQKEAMGVVNSVQNSSVVIGQDKKKLVLLEGNISGVSANIANILRRMDNETSEIVRVSKKLALLSTTLNPGQVQTLNQIIRRLENKANIDSELRQVQTEMNNLNKIVAGLKTSLQAVFSVSTLRPGSSSSTGVTAHTSNGLQSATSTTTSAKKPTHLPVTTSSTHTSRIPTLKPSSKTTVFKVPTSPSPKTVIRVPTLLPMKTPRPRTGIQVPTSIPMASPSPKTVIRVPTLAPMETPTPKVGFLIPRLTDTSSPKVPTLAPMETPTPKVGFPIPKLTTTSSSSPTTVFQVPTLGPMGTPSPKVGFQVPSLTLIPSPSSPNAMRVPKLIPMGSPTTKAAFRIPTLATKPPPTTKLPPPAFKPFKVPVPPFRIHPVAAKLKSSPASPFLRTPVLSPVPPQVLRPKVKVGKK